jgi:hypothetical protein
LLTFVKTWVLFFNAIDDLVKQQNSAFIGRLPADKVFGTRLLVRRHQLLDFRAQRLVTATLVGDKSSTRFAVERDR